MRMEFQVFHSDTVVTARGQERFKIQPWGVAGGQCGTTGSAVVNPDTPLARDIGKIDALPLGPGAVVRICGPSGGGYGDPFDRAPDLVALDVRAGLVSDAAARESYGVVLVDGGVEPRATSDLRADMRAQRGPRREFDYGPFREQLEARWPVDISAECALLANSLPPGFSARLCQAHDVRRDSPGRATGGQLWPTWTRRGKRYDSDSAAPWVTLTRRPAASPPTGV